MSTLITENLQDSGGSVPVATVRQGSAKAWVRFAQATPAVIASFNVSSVTDTSAGLFTVNFSNAMADGNYPVGGLVDGNAYGSYTLPTTTAFSRRTWLYASTTLSDLQSSSTSYGDLA